ncbi:hypothetical protein FHETE_9012 [Fusarium heterosporum]|uniref:Uncharacterized protein n=1 Tax=Fusarium heterosporum TaxID=42747 RepID=A0A8H5T0C5_FUSHE|nr:hypothetical protein FHETE_9012 [Fusarium heterosporum]
MDGNSRLFQAIIEAQDQLDKVRGPGLLDAIADADEKIRRANEDTEIARLEAYVLNQERREAEVGQHLQSLQDAVRWAKGDFKQGSEKVKELMKDFQKVMFRVTGLKVEASARDMTQGKPLKSTVTGMVGVEVKVFIVEWTPLVSVSDFYQAIAKQVISL